MSRTQPQPPTSTATSRSGLSRRSFLLAAAGVGAGIALDGPLLLRGCGRGTGSTEAGPYAVWRELQQALRASPDHAPGRAAALLKAGDPEALHRFVRDEIRLVSAEGGRFALGAAMPVGPRAALRAGAGTAREKAEVLAALLRRLGMEAEVMQASPLAREDSRAAFFRSFDQAFDPPISERQQRAWRQRLGLPPAGAGDALDIDPGGRRAEALAEQLLEALGPERERIGRHRFDDRTVGGVPWVRFVDAEGRERWANPVDPQADIVEQAPVRLRSAPEPDPALPVEVALSASFSEAPGEFSELVRGRWGADQLCGRQLRIGFKSPLSLPEWAASRLVDLRCFVPQLMVQALDASREEAAALSVAGEAFSIDGQRYAVAEDGSVSANGRPLMDAGSSAAASRVVRMELSVDSARFPELRLRLQPLDAEGKVVEGLPAAALRVLEQGEGVGFSLAANRAAPRVLFLADQSLSMPQQFRGGQSQMEALIARVRARLLEAYPGAELMSRPTGSKLWEELARAASQPWNLILYATDGDLDGRRPDARMLEALRQGPPALLLDVNGALPRLRSRPSNLFDEMAAATGGQAFAVDAGAEQVEAALLDYLDRHPLADPYRLACAASSRTPGRRRVRVEIGSAAVEADYEVPEHAALPRRLAALRLTVQVGRHRVERVLAGHTGTGELQQVHLDEAMGALFGHHLLAFEASPPALSVQLDELLAAKLSLEPLDRALAEPVELEQLEPLLAQGFDQLPGELLTLMARTRAQSGGDFSVATLGLRCALYSAQPVLNSDRFRTRVDLLPLERAQVLAEDRERLLRESLKRSADLAVAEAALFDTSTLALLEGRALAPVPRRPFTETTLSDEDKAAWRRLIEQVRSEYPHPGAIALGPVDGSVRALHVVDRSSGSFIAVLPDGSGGGSVEQRMQAQLAELDRVIAAINVLAAAAGAAGAVGAVGGVALGIVAAYGQRLARLYAAASVSIILSDASGIAPAVRLAIAGMACEVVKNIALGVFGGAGRVAARAVVVFTTVDNVVGMTGAENPFSCPI